MATLFKSVVTYSNADMKIPSPIIIVPAQGPGTFISLLTIKLRMNYGGTDAFTNNPYANISYDGSSTIAGVSFSRNVFWTATENAYQVITPPGNPSFLATTGVNKDLMLILNSAITGNAANDNTVTITTYYTVDS